VRFVNDSLRSARPARRREAALEIGDEVDDVLDAAGDADEAVGDAERLASPSAPTRAS
jgi:hypothetical protein